MKLSVWTILLVLWAGSLQGAPSVKLPQAQGRVNDYTATLDRKFVTALDQAIRRLESNGGPQIGVAVVDSTEPLSLEDYAADLFQHWGIGGKKKDNGLLILLALKDRRQRIEVGYGLEGTLTDAWAGRVRDQIMLPLLKQGDTEGAIWGACDAAARALGYAALDGGNVYSGQRRGKPKGFLFLLLLVFLVVILKIFGGGGRRVSGWHSSGYGGYGGGGGYSGGGFGGGGFGGGMSGGGGASGGW